jgi:hypothetical protein
MVSSQINNDCKVPRVTRPDLREKPPQLKM